MGIPLWKLVPPIGEATMASFTNLVESTSLEMCK